MRNGENIYQVVEDDKVIFEGTARTNGRLLYEWIAKVVEN